MGKESDCVWETEPFWPPPPQIFLTWLCFMTTDTDMIWLVRGKVVSGHFYATIHSPHDSVQTLFFGWRFCFGSIYDFCLEKQQKLKKRNQENKYLIDNKQVTIMKTLLVDSY